MSAEDQAEATRLEQYLSELGMDPERLLASNGGNLLELILPLFAGLPRSQMLALLLLLEPDATTNTTTLLQQLAQAGRPCPLCSGQGELPFSSDDNAAPEVS